MRTVKKMDNTAVEKTINISRWLEKRLVFENIDFELIRSALLAVLDKQRFEIRETTAIGNDTSIEAIYGSKFTATLLSLIPFGADIPWGKRLLIKIVMIKNTTIHLEMSITPYMDLFNEDEAAVLNQTPYEKVTGRH